jgi:hypothetical protein
MPSSSGFLGAFGATDTPPGGLILLIYFKKLSFLFPPPKRFFVSVLLVNIEHVGSFLLCREDLIFFFFFFGLLREKVPPRFLGKHLLLPPFSSHLSFSSDSSSSSSFELLPLSALRYLISNSRRLTFPSYSSPPNPFYPFQLKRIKIEKEEKGWEKENQPISELL